MVNFAASEYGRSPFGIIPHDTVIDEDKVASNFDPKLLRLIEHIVELVCEKYNLSKPGTEQVDLKTTFEEWFNLVAEKYGLKVRYDKKIFNN